MSIMFIFRCLGFIIVLRLSSWQPKFEARDFDLRSVDKCTRLCVKSGLQNDSFKLVCSLITKSETSLNSFISGLTFNVKCCSDLACMMTASGNLSISRLQTLTFTQVQVTQWSPFKFKYLVSELVNTLKYVLKYPFLWPPNYLIKPFILLLYFVNIQILQ